MSIDPLSNAVTELFRLINLLIVHLDKPAEELRLLNIQDLNKKLDALSEDLDSLIAKIKEEEDTQ